MWLVFAVTLQLFAVPLNNVHDVCAALPLAVHTHGACFLTAHELELWRFAMWIGLQMLDEQYARENDADERDL
jgi:hypothetical protein